MKLNLMKAFLACCLLMASGLSFAQIDSIDIKKAYLASYQYEKTQNYTDALKTISIVYLHYPKGYTVNLRMAYLYYLNGKYANSLKHYNTAHSVLPNAISPLLGKMSLAIISKKYNDAELAGFMILKADLYNYYGNLKLGYVLTQSGKLENAEKIIYKMLNKYPEDVAFLTQLAKLHVANKKMADATATYHTILILDPENITAKYFFSLHKDV